MKKLSLFLPLALFGCSVIAHSPGPQCAADTDCYVKFGGGYACQAGGCVSSSLAQQTPNVVTAPTTCRSTQECVASLGEGWLCRRNRDDPQKQGKCQQLTPTTECQIYGDYKNDQGIMLGAIVPGKTSPALATSVRSGIERAVTDWQVAIQDLSQTAPSADAIAPPRPFAIVACSEDVPESDLRNLFLNSGVVLVIGPSTPRTEMNKLTLELTNARLLVVSPTSVSIPGVGEGIGTYFFRVAGSDVAMVNAIKTAAPTALLRSATAYDALAGEIEAVLSVQETLFDDPATFKFQPTTANQSVVVLGDGDAALVVAQLPPSTMPAYVLPSAIPDIVDAFVKGLIPTPSPVKIQSFRALRSATVPTPPFGEGSFGDAEAYDSVYMALASIAAVGDTKSPEAVKEEDLRQAFLRASASDGKSFKANADTIKDLLKQLRTADGTKVFLEGATGTLVVQPTDLTTSRSFSTCTVTNTGCN